MSGITSPGRLSRAAAALLWIAFGWAALNCGYVYFVLRGNQTYRIESAVFIFALIGLLVLAGTAFGLVSPSLNAASLDRPDDPPPYVTLAIATGLWLAVMLSLVRSPFLSDDYGLLHGYRTTADIFRRVQFFRPALGASFVLLSSISPSPSLFHAVAFAGHLTSAWLVYGIARSASLSRQQAGLCYVVFLLNPLQLEAVLWPAALADVLWTLGVLAAIRVYVGSRFLTPVALGATLVCAAFALAAKEAAVSCFVLLPLADWVYFRFKRGRLLMVAWGSFAALAVGYLLLRSQFAAFDSRLATPPSRFFVKQFISTPYKVFAQPWAAGAVSVPLAVLCAVSIALLALIALAVRRGASRVLLGPMVILASTLPVYAFFAVFPDLRSSRYIYFAGAGWALLMSELIAPLIARHRQPIVPLALSAALAVSLALNARPWRAAGDLMATLREAVARGEDGRAAAVEWQARTGRTLTMDNGLPLTYQGVDIFVNGYPEFVALIRDGER